MLPWACDGVTLGGDVLQVGPGYGVTTRWLTQRGGRVTAAEVDPDPAAGRRCTFGGRVDVRTADGAAPLSDTTFDTVVCFTMLHHVRHRSSRTGCSPRRAFRLLYAGDTMVAVDPVTLPEGCTPQA